jgi:hypothetical protein
MVVLVPPVPSCVSNSTSYVFGVQLAYRIWLATTETRVLSSILVPAPCRSVYHPSRVYPVFVATANGP